MDGPFLGRSLSAAWPPEACLPDAVSVLAAGACVFPLAGCGAAISTTLPHFLHLARLAWKDAGIL
ncbi:MAG TPA: hypothetical protein QF730_09730 [Planctomycetota bacterium]|nr:hypothetical protein [Planctomycetota bacterium]